MTSTNQSIVLMYHGTPTANPITNYSLQACLFQRQLAYLDKNGWHFAKISDLLEDKALPSSSVTLTFDDGYADNFENAFLPLVENGMKATWFITTDCIGKHAQWMRPPSEQTKMLSADQIQEMSNAGMEIGSHTCSHPDLSQLPFKQQLDELTRSKQILEDIVQKPVTGFAYPFGRYNEDTLQAVQAAGYQWACSTRSGWFKKDDNPLLIRRVTVFSGDTSSVLARKLNFADNDVSLKKLANYYLKRLKTKLTPQP
ncbi:polysaccharide deacetylase family protein [Methylotuvimicrobium buryatense]|uniref:Polysaccharide deacetylase family protein n=1 Tax=Methylotuvimicrobium buryatense TaxID=95641 RepID=A0A4P9UND4_METBY|nr:polysaccharide deacetylase family protein [Methylotuvimicrobium buryatense]QCW81993.1 polysaccharide deacetylase family protein [Methylotuvimicrobium buryatense]